ncbi:dihydrofolate reductase family protein [Longimicrobium sp.]|uniref:dihydrofolate reductase family protein n=1 Tax=Longimicrobium sp. TaxID=2029185 RepID=UPI002CAB86EC|nr:dihydrofolate reductase family protein [Longimicrobium sp.]HSU17700.1 dihydrofolate reductase family protein [Longimicrobium sp.]
MRTVTYGAACSLDHFIARDDGAVDWLRWSDDVSAIMSAYWATVDTVLMGRKTYEAAVANGSAGSSPGVKGYVFSRTMTVRPLGGVELVTGDAAPFVRELKSLPGKGICVMGGGDLARSLFEADLIDEVGANVHPVLLGSGIPLFRPFGRQLDLELLENRAIGGGCVYLLYRVKR